MNEHDPTAKGVTPEGTASEVETEVRRLLEGAGPRPPIPPEDLEAITAAARTAWRREVERRTGDPEAPPAPEIAVPAELARRRRPRPQARGSRRLPAWTTAAALAATLVVSAGLAWWWLRGGGAAAEVARVESVIGVASVEPGDGPRRRLAAGEPIPAGAALVTAAGTGPEVGGRTSLRLSDGTVVRLDAGTVARFDSPTSLALGRGAIYADSGEGVAGLTVTTAAGTASDIGTRFTVRLLDLPEPALEVRVRDGAVAVETGDRRWVAPAGEELVVGPDREPQRRPIDPWGPDWDWVLDAAAGYRIEGRTLGDLLAWVTRETGWTVRWADPALETSASAIVLRGDLGRLRPDQAPFAVLPGAGLEGELVAAELVVRRR